MKHFLALLILFLLTTFSTSSISTTVEQYTTTVLVYGDSLSANYGISTEAGWVHLLEQRLQALTPSFQVVNTSISGETTVGGLRRIKQTLEQHHPNIIILELGANDGLRGTAITTIYENLEAIIKICQQYNTSVLLVGMQLPPNYGKTYTRKFMNIYPQLAHSLQTALVPFLFAGFEEKHDFFQADGIHPTAAAQAIIVENVWQVLHSMIRNDITMTQNKN